MGQNLIELLEGAVNLIQENHNEILSDSIFSGSALMASFRSFVYSPIFIRQNEQNFTDIPLYGVVIQSTKRLLEALTKVYKEYSSCVISGQSDTTPQPSSGCDTPVNNTYSVDNDKNRIVDIELDINDDSRDVNSFVVGGKISSVSPSAEKWKFGMISLISRFFPVLHVFTRDILFELLDEECNSKVYIMIYKDILIYKNPYIQKLYYLLFFIFIFYYFQVRERIIYELCKHPYWSSSTNIADLVWE